MKFPDFIIIGAMKCATTVLWHNLNKHPDINMCKNWQDPKIASTEIRFWNNGAPHHTWEKGIDWYKSLFRGDCCGEKSANYIEEYIAMKRMSEHVPNVKLILCIRNPVDRAYSEYQMQKDRISGGINRGHLQRGLYYEQIKNNVLPFFPKENLYILIQERMKDNVVGEMNRLYDFLNVKRCNFDIMEVTSDEATNRNLDLNKDSEVKSYKKWSTNYKPMFFEDRENVNSFYEPHNIDLFNFLRYDIEEWRL